MLPDPSQNLATRLFTRLKSLVVCDAKPVLQQKARLKSLVATRLKKDVTPARSLGYEDDEVPFALAPLHEGSILSGGNVPKYVVRSDILYTV